MPTLTFHLEAPVAKTARVLQLAGLFDIPPADRSSRSWTVDVPAPNADWQVGLIVGPSGSGKSTLARAAFGDALIGGYEWPADKAVVDGFPADLSVKDVTAALSSVGFSSPPSWVRPFRCLSNGEQFRATLARALCDPRPLVVVDEFTSVVDRTVARIGSAAVAKTVRRQPGKRFVAVTCHDDVAEWLCPDWVIDMPNGTLTRRALRRPPIELEVRRVRAAAWDTFKHHHYLDASLHPSATCFAAFWQGRPVAFASAIHCPGRVCWWREHRTVCLPDYQGVGIGNALSDFVAGVMRCLGKPYRSTTAHPAIIRHRAKSPLWRMTRPPSLGGRHEPNKSGITLGRTRATERFTAGFEYVGPPRPDDARSLLKIQRV
ncbi:GNAT family N-acetyltransferase [Fimbriiglobus ruber]|uniref:Putative ABC transporter n=1 Tax=Fimbriiglobus ruber TaxID=1908690 RepID=A0A225DW94_9BACT|nr:GNAT family N-acetyltransferase [Fimbriiglobus ruber]OWK45810.1 putative ABC transporter [Fimbriiglobus ruber]